MPHSYARPTDLPCPQCGHTFHAELWLILDAAERPDLLDRLRRGELHTLTCPHCGHTAEADVPLLLFFPKEPLRLVDPQTGARGPEVKILFSLARRATPQQNQQHAQALLAHLRQILGDAWQDEWVAQGIPGVPREMLPALLSPDPQAALRELAERQQRELERLRREDPSQFLHLMLSAFVQVPDLNQKRTILENTPELLTDEADALLEQLIQAAKAQQDENARQLFEQHRNLLRRCREVGIEQAFQEQSQGERWQERLTETLFAFIQAKTWDESRRILEQHPELLTDEADALLEQLIQAAKAQQDENARQLFEQHRNLLRRCREVGIEAAFQEIGGGPSVPPEFQADLRRILTELSRPMGILEMPYRVNLCLQALRQVKREQNPALWAALQVELGNSLLQNPQGERAENLEQAIAAYQQAL
ncbi:MAG: CpXC domain-containing protein, partial [Anaerolineales bacterium]